MTTPVSQSGCTLESLVPNLRDRPRFAIPSSSVPYFFMSVAPNGGSSRADFAIVSGFKHQSGQIIICGVENEPLGDTAEMKALCVKHLKKCYELFPFVRQSTVFFVVESNLSNESQHLWEHMKTTMPEVQLYKNTSDPSNRIGVYVTYQSLLDDSETMQRLLGENRLSFMESLAVVGSSLNPSGEDTVCAATEKLVCDQLAITAMAVRDLHGNRRFYRNKSEPYTHKDVSDALHRMAATVETM